MEFADLQKYIGPLATIAGAFSAMVGVFFWWHKRVVGKLEAEVEKVRAERMVAIQEKQAADARAETAGTAKTAAVEEKNDILGKARDLRGRYETTKKQRDDATAHRDQLVAELAASGGEHQRKLHEQNAAWERFAAARKEEIARLTDEKAAVVAERDTLAGKLDDARGKLADERRPIRGLLKQQGKIWLAKVPSTVPRFRPLKERKTVIIAVLNLKGGVGKTTITANLAGVLGELGKKVLMIDLDHQRSLSQMLLQDADLLTLLSQKKSVQTYFTAENRDGPLLLSKYASVVGMKNCDLIVNLDPQIGDDIEAGLEELEMQLMVSWLVDREQSEDVRFLLRSGLHSESVTNSYDYVFLDCPPRLSTACVNALAAADFVIVPVQPEAVASQSVAHLLYRLSSLREYGVAPKLQLLGILGNQLQPRKEMETGPEVSRLKEIASTMPPSTWPDPVHVFETVLPRMTQYFDASRETEQGGRLKLAIKFPAVRSQYEHLANEIQERINECRNSQ